MAPLELHPMVEFVNRMITGVVSVAIVLAVLGSLRRAAPAARPDAAVARAWSPASSARSCSAP